MKIFIQNMVCLRCIILVKSVLDKLNIDYKTVELGEVTIPKNITANKKKLLKEELQKSGLELMDDKKTILIENIIKIIIEMVHYTDEMPTINFSDFLSQKMGLDYHKMAEIFSKTKGITIEQFIILHKIEKIKELIIYDELNLTEISYKMHYSSVAHLSKQFKQVTGFTPSAFKLLKTKKRSNLDNL